MSVSTPAVDPVLVNLHYGVGIWSDEDLIEKVSDRPLGVELENYTKPDKNRRKPTRFEGACRRVNLTRHLLQPR